MNRFEYVSSRDFMDEEKRNELNVRLHNGELAIRGIIRVGTDYRVAITVFDEYGEMVTPEKCKEIAGKLSDVCKEDISIVEIELGSQKRAIYFAHENCFRILANGLKIYENDNGSVSKVAIPLGRDIYKYYKSAKCRHK